jgi:hypothetical protein
VEVQEVETEVRLHRLATGNSPSALPFTGKWRNVLSWWRRPARRVIGRCSSIPSKTVSAPAKEEYDNLGDCLITLLKVQEKEHERRQQETGIR